MLRVLGVTILRCHAVQMYLCLLLGLLKIQVVSIVQSLLKFEEGFEHWNADWWELSKTKYFI